MADLNFDSLLSPSDELKYFMETDEGTLNQMFEQKNKIEMEKENLPMTATDEGMMQPPRMPCRLPFAPPLSPLQPSTSTNIQRLFAFDSTKKQADTRTVKQRSRQSQSRRRVIRNRGASTSRAARTDNFVKSGQTEQQHTERVVELYLNDESVPWKLKRIISKLEASRNPKTVLEMIKPRNIIEHDHDYVIKKKNRQISIANVLFDGDYSALNFQWSPMSSFIGKQENFVPDEVPGPRKPTTCCYEAFRQFWDDDILEHIVKETNRYGSQWSSSFSTVWIDTNKHEILILFAFWMMLGIIQMPAIDSCFSEHDLLKTNIFGKLFSKERYKLLNHALHFVDDATRRPDSSKLFSLGPMVDYFNKKFSEAYTLSRDVAINESLTVHKNPLSFKKPIRFKSCPKGINFHALCESSTGYLWSFMIYSSADHTALRNVLPRSMEVVVQLMKPLLNKGYRLFIDNWYNYPLLARFLKRNNTDCVGTLWKTRKYVPDLIRVATIPEGSCVARHSGDVVVMTYQDKRAFYIISTCHGTDSVPVYATSKSILRYKPVSIVDYNKCRGGVDRMNKMLKPFLISRKCGLDWHRKFFERLLTISVINSYIIVTKSSNDNKQQLAFHLKLVDKIVRKHLNHVPKVNKSQKLPDDSIFSTTHFIIRIKVSENNSAKNQGRAQCVWCTTFNRKYRKTVYKCEQCNIPLCLKDCFKAYHTKR